MTTGRMLPEPFADLERFASTWVLPSANERYQRRLESSMPEMQDFYDSMVARGDAIWAYFDDYGIDDLPEEGVNLLWMLCSLSAVSFAIDVFKQPKVIDSGDTELPFTFEPVP